jgi:hypothetical protein
MNYSDVSLTAGKKKSQESRIRKSALTLANDEKELFCNQAEPSHHR